MNELKVMLSDDQLFQLAKIYIYENDVKGFNDSFMFMTRKMRQMLQEELNRKEASNE